MPRAVAVLVLACALLLPARAGAKVVPGVGIGGVSLGMSQSRAIAVRGQPQVSALPSASDGQPRSQLMWPGLTATVTGSSVTVVTTRSKAERLSSGVGVGSTERALRRGLRVRCGTYGGHRSCTRGVLRPGGHVTIFTIGPRTHRIVDITVSRIDRS